MSEPLREYEHGYTCKEVVELATEYIDGTLSADDTTLFELHLNFCDGCYTFIDQVRQTATAAAKLTEEQVPEDVKGKLLAAFRDWRSS